MNRDQAAEILEHLLEATHELDEAKAAAAVLQDRMRMPPLLRRSSSS
jgi:hypothetical protein